MFKHQST